MIAQFQRAPSTFPRRAGCGELLFMSEGELFSLLCDQFLTKFSGDLPRLLAILTYFQGVSADLHYISTAFCRVVTPFLRSVTYFRRIFAPPRLLKTYF